MSFSRLLTTATVVVALLSTSCQSRKIAYGNSYYFKATPRETPPLPELLASTAAPASVASVPVASDIQLATTPSRLLPKQKAEERTLTRREMRQARRAQRKAVRTQLKQWLRAAPPKDADVQAAQRMEGLTRAGVIAGAAGLVMLLIGVLASVGFLTGLGGIVLAIAVVLILIEVTGKEE